MSRVFADTFYFLAVLNRRDPAHEAALAFYGDPALSLLTTEWVLAEVADANALPAMRQGCKQLFELLEQDSRVQILPASHESFQQGLQLYHARPDKAWSLTDCISFTVMTRQHLTDALTGDRHFKQAGFAPLL